MNTIANVFIKYRRFWGAITQIVLTVAAYILSFYLRFEFSLPEKYKTIILSTLPILLLIKTLTFYFFGLFSGVWRYASIDDSWRIIKATVVSTILFVLTVIFTHGIVGFPRSVFILDWVLCTVLVGGVRFSGRLIRELYSASSQKRAKNVIIVGAGESGVMVLREYRKNPSMSAKVVGFIDDDPIKKNSRIQGIKVLGSREDITVIVERLKVEEIIIAIPSAKGETIRQLLTYCQIPNIKIKIVPGLHKIINGELEVKPREVRPEDLLGREAVKINEEEIASYIKARRVLITGAGGSIGSELVRQAARFNPEKIILFDHNENDVYFLQVELKTKYPKAPFETVIGDINDIGLLKNIFSQYRPQVIFHSAAYKHVPLMEDNPIAAIKNNVLGSRNLIYAAHHYKAERFVLISTDKAVNPISIMGMTKRIAEMILQAKAKSSNTRFMAVRFGNVIGSSGSVVPLFKKQIEEGGPITVTHPEAKRYFMSVHEAVSLVLQAAAIGNGGEIFILDMGEQIKIIDIAQNLVTLSGLKLEKDISLQFIGLRPGEKLSEEILLNTEKDLVTKHNKIYIAQPDSFDPVKLRRQIRGLKRAMLIKDTGSIKDKIKEILNS